MNNIQAFANKHALTFAAVVTFVFILLVILSAIFVSARWPADTSGWYVESTVSRLVSIFILLATLARLDWLGPAGFKSLGRWNVWLFLPLPLAYAVAMSTYAMTGNFDFSISDPVLTGAASLFILNLAGYLNLGSNATDGTPFGWLLLSLGMIPLAVYGLYLLRSLPEQQAIPVAT
jgi:hypothetical protein